MIYNEKKINAIKDLLIAAKSKDTYMNPIQAFEKDFVSEYVAKQMALHVVKMFSSNYGISITGYAVRVPKKNINELYAYCAVAYRRKIINLTRLIPNNNKEAFTTQLDHTNQVIDLFSNLLHTPTT